MDPSAFRWVQVILILTILAMSIVLLASAPLARNVSI